MELNQIEYEGLKIIDYNLEVPLDYTINNSEKISIFARKVSRMENSNKSLPYLIFFQGGPGFESPRPISDSGWIKRASDKYNIILIDQRGTGLSSPISIESIKGMSDNQIAKYLTFFRADNIVRDAELLRKNIFKVEKWSVLGQSFGGFCAMNYLSFHSDHLQKVFITGGIPPLDAHPDDIYRAT
ncbi:MAG: alpha/beta fold hydrolase, partial [Candidatus Neomarinimicrobiota bacterium]